MKFVDLKNKLNLMYRAESDTEAFWDLVQRYAYRIVTQLVPPGYVDDAVQQGTMAAFVGISKFTPTDDPNCFTNWLGQVVRNNAISCVREDRSRTQIPVSQLSHWSGDRFIEANLESLPNSTAVTQFVESFADADAAIEERFTREDGVSSTLDSFRELLETDEDRAIFGALREEDLTPYEVAQRMGLTETRVYDRLKSWRRKAARIVKNRTDVSGLDKLRELLTSKDVQLFDLLRGGVKRVEAARICGRNVNWPSRRLAIWKEMAEREGLKAAHRETLP